jgi:carbon-monoxide dehydrogenase large subunit
MAWRRFSLKKLRLARSAAYGFGERVLGTSRGSARRLHKHVADRCYRGAGKPEANYLIERLVDPATRRLGVDPIALRRRNLISRFPYRSGLGVTIDCGRFAANLGEMAQRIRDDGFAERRRTAAERGRLRGLGIACFLETSRGTPGERAEIRFEPDGRIALVLGTQSNGQGHETSFAQIAADLLGMPIAAFSFVQADTRAVKSGNGHGGARSMHMGGTALSLAAQMVLSKAHAIAAHLLQADASEVSFGTGRFTVGGGERGIGLLALAEAARDPANLPDGMSPGLDADAYNDSDVFTFPNGCHAAEIEINPETGAATLERYLAIDDYGRLINPMLTKGQVHGGVAQGIGQALLEHTVYEEQSGQLLSGSFFDYALPRADDLPPLEITLAELPTAVNSLGVKGAGQAGCMAAPQTIINAILDALAPLGIAHIDMPASPERIWRAIRSARRG